MPRAGILTVIASDATRCISICSRSPLKNARCSNRPGSKSAPSSRLTTARMFLLNAAVTPAASLYAASSTETGFTISSPTRKRSPSSITAATLPSIRCAAGSAKFPMVLPKNVTSLFLPRGMRPISRVKSPTIPRRCSRGYLRSSPSAAVARADSLTSTGIYRMPSPPGPGAASMSCEIFWSVPGPSSTRSPSPKDSMSIPHASARMESSSRVW